MNEYFTMKHIKSIDSFVNESVSASQIEKALGKAEKKLGSGASAEELANYMASELNVKAKYEEILNVITTSDADDKELAKDIASVVNENVLSEAARVGRSSWSSILRDLRNYGWDISGDTAYKSYANNDDEERELQMTSRYGSDEVEYTVNDENGDEIDSGSFDAEGLSAGELDSEVWSNIEESVNEAKLQGYEWKLWVDVDDMISQLKNKYGGKVAKGKIKEFILDYVNDLNEAKEISIKDYKVGDVISFKDGEDWKVTKVKYDKLMVKPHNEKAKKANTSIEIDIDLDYLKNNLAESILNEGVVSIKGARIIAHKVLNKLVDIGLIPVKKKSEDLLETIAEIIINTKMESVETENTDSINEGRTIEKIEKDRTKIINDMAEVVTNWKAAKGSGDKEAEASFLQRLKDLTAQKNGLEKELNAAIAGKDRYVELVISESAMSEIDLLAKETKTFKEFVKEFKKEFGEAGDPKELESWLKSIYDNAKNESMNEGEDVKKGIHDHWKEIYGEDFVSAYPKVAKILKNRQNVDRRELARIWDETYGEDFKEKYAKIWDVLD